jgi:hypothetical protein
MDIHDAIAALHFPFAKTMANNPHEYTTRRADNETAYLALYDAVKPNFRCARRSWRDPAGASPAQVRGSARLVVSVASAVATPSAKRTQQSSGVG